MPERFVWGEVIACFSYDFDGPVCEVVKYHPHNAKRTIDRSVALYHHDGLHQSFHSLHALLIAWIAYRHLGLNQHALVAGLCKALDINEEE